eukprot:9192162-Prorocentrum_lima.AAC.1
MGKPVSVARCPPTMSDFNNNNNSRSQPPGLATFQQLPPPVPARTSTYGPLLARRGRLAAVASFSVSEESPSSPEQRWQLTDTHTHTRWWVGG